jgi:uncharacterized protein (TIGR02217 family)
MAFFESPRFPEAIAFGAVGGPRFSTTVVETVSGREQRTGLWQYPLHEWDVAQGVKTSAQFAALRAFFLAARGRLHTWRFKDWADYQVQNASEGIVASPGWPAAQLYKRYISGGQSLDRKITKPVAGTVALYNGAALLSAGSDYTLDTTTGIASPALLYSQAVSAVAVGASTSVTLAAALTGLTAGGQLYLTGLTGADAALLNGQAWPVSGVAGAVYTLSVNTAGKTITPAGTGKLYLGGRASDALNWAGEFDIPMRFDADALAATIADRGADGLLHTWQSIKIVEVRL